MSTAQSLNQSMLDRIGFETPVIVCAEQDFWLSLAGRMCYQWESESHGVMILQGTAEPQISRYAAYAFALDHGYQYSSSLREVLFGTTAIRQGNMSVWTKAEKSAFLQLYRDYQEVFQQTAVIYRHLNTEEKALNLYNIVLSLMEMKQLQGISPDYLIIDIAQYYKTRGYIGDIILSQLEQVHRMLPQVKMLIRITPSFLNEVPLDPVHIGVLMPSATIVDSTVKLGAYSGKDVYVNSVYDRVSNGQPKDRFFTILDESNVTHEIR